MDLREDVESFFGELKTKYGVDPDAVPPPSAPLEEAREAMEEHRDTPPSPAIPVVEEVTDDDPRYPGSNQRRRSIAAAEESVEEEDEDPVWDDRPRIYAIRGQDTELFPISALAVALRRKAVTMRKWETNGYLPSARYRSPGEGKKQDRLYTRAQIEGLVAIAKDEGLMHPAKKHRIDQTRFPERAHRLFEALERSTT